MLSCPFFSQEKKGQLISKIKIEKQPNFVKAGFDESDYKVIAFDKYGNPYEQVIKSFTINYKDGKTNYARVVKDNVFPIETIKFLTKKRKEVTKICLTEIVAEAKDGHLESLPELCDIAIFPDCKKTH